MIAYTCFACGELITSTNNSKEHIIPNSIGGRKKVKNFICQKCNGKFGETWDADLAEQLNPLTLLVGIKRERGDAPPQIFSTSQGKEYKITHGYQLETPHPVVEERELDDKKVQLRISASSHREIRQILKGLERKYPGISTLVDVETLGFSEEYAKGAIHIPMTIGAGDFGKSLVKSCLALASHARISDEYRYAKRYLCSEDSPKKNWAHCSHKVVKDRDSFDIFHCVHVEASREHKVVVGYVEYFSAYKFLILLSDCYTGCDMSATYGIDPVSGQEISMNISLGLDRASIFESIENFPDFEELKNSIGYVIDFCQRRSWEKEQKRVTRKAVEHAFEKIGLKDGDILRPEHIPTLVNVTLEKITPFWVHTLTGNDELEQMQLESMIKDAKRKKAKRSQEE